MRLFFGIALVLLGVFLSPAWGYELTTHGAITQNAYGRFLETQPDVLGQLGLTIIDEKNSFGSVYYDIAGNVINKRDAKAFEGDIIKESLGLEPLSIQGWLMRGVIREDDYITLFGADNPQDDPDGNFVRPYHHFFDPVNNVPLNGVSTPFSGGVVHTAPAWALGTTNTDAFSNPIISEGGRRNHFTVLDAREAMYRALTGMNKAGNKTIGLGNRNAIEADRKAYWATTFRALGDVMHLLQDMAQPQHTRNDPHSPANSDAQKVYEEFTNQRALNKEFTCFNGSKRSFSVLPYTGYPVTTQFNQYSDFFSTTPGADTSGKGLADYSNRGFFTAGTNLKSMNNSYNSPPNDPAMYSKTTLNRNNSCLPIGAKAELFGRAVEDTLLSSNAPNVPLTARALWDIPVRFAPRQELAYSLIEENYVAMADLLIPRAVGYSAGLINYFFRGRMEISPPDEGIYAIIDHATNHSNAASGNGLKPVKNDGTIYGFTTIKLKLRNITPDIVEGQTIFPQNMTSGTLHAVVKYRLNPCYEPNLSGELDDNINIPSGCDPFLTPTDEVFISTSAEKTVQAGELDSGAANPTPYTFDFTNDPVPINATTVDLQVVFRGKLGSENDAVVVTTKDISEPTYLAYRNTTDYFSLDGVLHTKQQILGNPVLFDRVDTNNDGVYDENDMPILDPFSFSGGKITIAAAADIIQFGTLNPGDYIRVAYLADNGVVQITTNVIRLGKFSFQSARNWLVITNPQTMSYSYDFTAFDVVGELYFQQLIHAFNKFPPGSADGDPAVIKGIMDPGPTKVQPINF